MNVLIVNTSERTGGAAVAAGRLMAALNNHGVKARMLVRDRQAGSDALTVTALGGSWRQQWRFLWERLVILLHLHGNRRHLFEIDIANTGCDITRRREFREADVVHLHWVNQGMLSLGDIGRILRSGKPVVWTMHDAWPATALCHYTRGCGYFKSGCHHCQLLPGGGGSGDLSARVWRQKQRLLAGASVFFVACSRWLEGEARRSALLSGQKVTSIPNPIDTQVFRPADRDEARRALGLPAGKRVILFVSQRVTDARKGMDYFTEALQHLAAERPALAGEAMVAILGGHADEVAGRLPLPARALGYVSREQDLVTVYSAADVFVLPSLEDNLPNTVMEAMACGVPCVGFKVGGIPEMIDHQRNGYVARCRDAADLACGIGWVLGQADGGQLRAQCLRKVAHAYSQSAVAMRYVEVYNQAMAMKHYKL